MKPHVTFWCSFTLILLALIGCGKDAGSLASKSAALFQSAAPEVRADWSTATAAMKTNGYVTAILTLKRLQQQTLTPAQLSAVNETVTAVSDQMYAASNKGDAAAAQAIQDLRKAIAR